MAKYQPPAPFIAPYSGEIDQKLAMVAEVINRKADVTSTPTYKTVRLIAPNNTVYEISVSNAGVLSTAAVPRT